MPRRSVLKQGAGLRPNKRLGQHFLVDRAVPGKIIQSAAFPPSSVVLEIGPGRGALTLPLSRAVSQVVAVEKDMRLAEALRERLSALGISNVLLVCEDILRFDIETIPLPLSGKIQVIGNLPYNISSPVLERLMRHRERLERAVLMFQREVATRLTSLPGAKGYGAMTLLIRYDAKPTWLLEVSRGAFYPVPKVDSAVVELDFQQPYPCEGVGQETFRQTVKGAFAHRRKTLLNSLKGFHPAWTPEFLLEGMRSCGIDPKRRAETLSMDEFLALASALAVDKDNGG